ncbi:MAG TPA: GNAT family N-acetyltransferase [Candidatus Acidoferrales bacterium]|jgi:L-amino acid N-acyltransferase YncA|nr:GNAT family N-acetyltransferase [Candidatus Acidoferrales bacterium]
MATPEARPQLLIRPAVEGDALVMREIFNEGVQDHLIPFEDQPRSIEELQSQIKAAEEDARHPMLVAELRGWVLGWIALGASDVRPQLDDVGEVSVCVRRSFRNYGVGRQLMQAMQETAARIGYRKLVGRVLAANPDSLRLCVACGWREVGRLVGHDASYGERRDIAIVEIVIETAGQAIH